MSADSAGPAAGPPPAHPPTPPGAEPPRFPSCHRTDPIASFADRWRAKRADHDRFVEAVNGANARLPPAYRLPDALAADWLATWTNDLFLGVLPQHDRLTPAQVVATIEDVAAVAEALRFSARRPWVAAARRAWFYELATDPRLGMFPTAADIARHRPELDPRRGLEDQPGDISLVPTYDQAQFLDAAAFLLGEPTEEQLAWLRRLAYRPDPLQPLWTDPPRHHTWARQQLARCVPELSGILGVSWPELGPDDLPVEELVRRVHEWVVDKARPALVRRGWARAPAGGPPEPSVHPSGLLPPGVPADPAPLVFDLPAAFREAVDLADAVRGEHTFETVGHHPDVIRYRLVQRLNPRGRRLSPYPEYERNELVAPSWGQEVEHAPGLTADARRALIALALAVADVDGAFAAFPDPRNLAEQERESELLALAQRRLAAARDVLALASAALWAAMDDSEREAVGQRVYERARRAFGWAVPPSRVPDGLPGWGTPGRMTDPHRWRTTYVHIPEPEERMAPETPASAPVVYPLPRVSADALPADLREACAAAWEVVGHASVLAYLVQFAVGPLAGTVRAIEDAGTPQERVVAEYPPCLVVTADMVAEAVGVLDEGYRRCLELLRPLRSELIVSGTAYSDGELHTPCAHDAALTFAHDVRGRLDLLVRITPKATPVTSASSDDFLPPGVLRDNWDSFLRVFRSIPDRFDGLPSASRLQAALVREAVLASARRPSPVAWSGAAPTSSATLPQSLSDGPPRADTGSGIGLPNPAALPADRGSLPPTIRNWLAARFLSDPTPDELDGERVVFVPLDDFTAFLMGLGRDVLATLEACDAAGWTSDLMVELTESDDPSERPSHGVARLNLPLGRHRVVGIRPGVLLPPPQPDNPPPPATTYPAPQSAETLPPRKTGRKPDPVKPEVVAYVRELREGGMKWRDIPEAVFKRFRKRYTAETLRGYEKAG